MASAPPSSAGLAVFGFASDVWSALLLRRSLYDEAAADPMAWRRAGLVIILAGMASDSIGLYSDVDAFLVLHLASWSLVPIMLVALARWTAGTLAAHTICRIFGESVSFESLMRGGGFAYAPGLILAFPAVIYWLDIVQVTVEMVSAIRWLSLPWLVSALTIAARAAGVSTWARALAVAAVFFVASNLFDVVLDAALVQVVGGADPLGSSAGSLPK